MNKPLLSLALSAIFFIPGAAGIAAQIALTPTKDNSIYGEANGNSNGLGDHFVAGKAGGGTTTRRGLIAFDLSSLPSPVRVDRVALQLTYQGTTNMENDPRVVALHRLLADWGEGTSDAGPGGSSGAGNGTAATPGDATWQYRFFNTQNWSSYTGAAGSGGGDFIGQASATATVGIDPGVLITWETIRSGPPTGLVADVEQWLANPSSNFGWLLKLADESALRTARRFYSKDASNAAFHPRLVIDYSVVPEPTAIALAVIAALALLGAARSRPFDLR